MIFCYICIMKKIERIFHNALEAAKPISCQTVGEAIEILGISEDLYLDYENSDNFSITIKPTGRIALTNGCETNEVLLIIEWE